MNIFRLVHYENNIDVVFDYRRYILLVCVWQQVLSSSWDGRPFGCNRHWPKSWGVLDPHITQCGMGKGLPPYQLASWSIQPFGHKLHWPKIGGCASLGELGLHLTQCGQRLPPCKVSSWSIHQFGHNTPMSQTDRQTDSQTERHRRWSDSIWRTVFQTVT